MTAGLLLALLLVVAWFTAIAILVTPSGLYSSKFDKLTKAKYRKDRINLQIMLDHLRSYPEQWSINRNAASFPLEGPKQIYLNYDKNLSSWKYTLDAFDDGPRLLDGHFGSQFDRQLTELNNKKENQALLRTLHKDLDPGVLLLR